MTNLRRGFSSPGFEQGQQSEYDSAVEAAADRKRLAAAAADLIVLDQTANTDCPTDCPTEDQAVER